MRVNPTPNPEAQTLPCEVSEVDQLDKEFKFRIARKLCEMLYQHWGDRSPVLMQPQPEAVNKAETAEGASTIYSAATSQLRPE